MKILRIIFITLFIFTFCAQASFAQKSNIKRMFNEANSLYEKSKFEKAVALYEEIIKSGYENGQIYYNLANAYFKTGSLSFAILNYERAKRFMPNDKDLLANLKYANTLVGKTQAKDLNNLFLKFSTIILGIFSIDSLTLISFFIYLGFIFFLILNIFTKTFRRKFFYTMGILLLLMLLLLNVKIYQTQYIKEAIVMTEESDSRFEPFDDAPVHFILNEGAKIRILKEEGEWFKIKQLDGKIGWIKSTSCEII